ncbi:MAG TPA: group II intron maturase-specific domain-containing protein, partial [Candidatus Tectomicrobia bacterium]
PVWKCPLRPRGHVRRRQRRSHCSGRPAPGCLNLLDHLWHRRGYPEKPGATLHRYADDAILVCRRSPQPVLAAFEAIATRMELTLNREKTRVTRLTDGFDFVGFNFVKRKSPSRGKNTIYLFPAKSTQQKIRNRLKYLTSRRAPIGPKEFVEMVKPIVTGWVNYFRHTNASQAFRGGGVVRNVMCP